MHNAGVASLAQDDDWNFIANQTGDASWEASKMSRYFREIEKNEYRASTDKNHGFNGEFKPTRLRVENIPWLSLTEKTRVALHQRWGSFLGKVGRESGDSDVEETGGADRTKHDYGNRVA